MWQNPPQNDDGRDTNGHTGGNPEQPDSVISAAEHDQPSTHWLDVLLTDPMAAELVGPNFNRLSQKWRACFWYVEKPEAMTWHSPPFSPAGLVGHFSWDNVKSLIWPAVFGPYWFFYRRLYMPGAVLLGLSLIIGLLPHGSVVSGLALSLLSLHYAPSLYLCHVRDAVTELKNIPGTDEKAKYIAGHGHTSWPAAALAVFAAFVITTTANLYFEDEPASPQTTAQPNDRFVPREQTAQSEQSSVASCNDRNVIHTLVDGTVGKFKTAALNMLKMPGSFDQDVFQAVSTLDASVTSISQSAYDPANGTRTCEGEFNYTSAGDLSVINAVTPILRLDPNVPTLCPRGVTYQVRRLLDDPSSFNVAWECD